ncbi:hypothetical protein FQN50_001549 [Emmonsiellopsis sp. PD_5]|nr:hypothetical protein FQN50_001549 [Emmonsiellopsis sp. PD_5]
MLASAIRGRCATPIRPAGSILFTPPAQYHLYHRIQFSTTSQRSKPPSTTTSPTASSPVIFTSPVTPPSTTRPAPLDLPSKPISPADSKLKYYYALGKAYVSFYKSGLKHVYHNYRASLPLRRSLKLPPYLPTSPPPPAYSTKKPNTATLSLTHYSNTLTRAQFQLIRRSAYDVRRMLPFSLILLVCGEMTPFVVLVLGNAVTPLTCRVPRQVEKERIKRIEAKERAVRAAELDNSKAAAGGKTAAAIANLDMLINARSVPNKFDINAVVNKARASGVLRACAVFGLAKNHEFPVPFLPGFLRDEVVNQVYRPRLRRWMRYLEVDDWLIFTGGGVGEMSVEEVRTAVEERGGVDVSIGMGAEKAEKVERKWLAEWVDGRGFK